MSYYICMTREFEQKWVERKNPINHHTECNVLFDMIDFLSRFGCDLKSIVKFAKKEFDLASKEPIEKYVETFEKLRNKFAEICLKNPRTGLSMSEMEYYKPDLIQKTENGFEFGAKYYKKLNKVAKAIFKLEDKIKTVTDKFWLDACSDVKNFDRDGEYFLLAHADYKPIRLDEMKEDIAEYAKKQKGVCFSTVSDKKTKLYDQNNQFCRGIVGIVAKPQKDAIVGISQHDMVSIEFCDGECKTPDQFWHSKVDKCFDDGHSQIYCSGTKICPPQAIFETCADTINEIILNKDKIEIEAVFFVTDTQGRKPQRLEEFLREQEKLAGKKLDVIELKPRNRLQQYDLDEVFSA